MTEDPHVRARQLMLDEAIGTLATADLVWLTGHLAECPVCRQKQEGLISTVSTLLSSRVSAPPFLAARTRAGLRSHAAELQKTREKRLILLLAVCFDVVWTTMIVGLILGAASWMGFRGEMRWWIIGAISWLWLLPAIAMMLFVTFRKNGLAPSMGTWNGLYPQGESHD
jgi:hypothetical protein